MVIVLLAQQKLHWAAKRQATKQHVVQKNRSKPEEKSREKQARTGPLSPLEPYITHQKQEIENQEGKIESLEEELAEPCCTKCHRKEGHNRLNCPYPAPCSSALFCGNIDKHPDDKRIVKQKAKQLTEERKSLLAMKDELKNGENECKHR